MTNKIKIRIIKKKDLQVVRKVVKNERKLKQDAAKKMVSNVSSWVNDLKKRKCDETKHAIGNLFPAQPQTDGA